MLLRKKIQKGQRMSKYILTDRIYFTLMGRGYKLICKICGCNLIPGDEIESKRGKYHKWICDKCHYSQTRKPKNKKKIGPEKWVRECPECGGEMYLIGRKFYHRACYEGSQLDGDEEEIDRKNIEIFGRTPLSFDKLKTQDLSHQFTRSEPFEKIYWGCEGAELAKCKDGIWTLNNVHLIDGVISGVTIVPKGLSDEQVKDRIIEMFSREEKISKITESSEWKT